MTKKSVVRLALGVLALASFSVVAQVHVDGYTRRDGTYVAPTVRSSPNNTKLDNYSTRGNVNPYTGNEGTRDPYAQPSTNQYAQPQPNPYSRQQQNIYGQGH